jgi:hypothetical protein
MIILFGCFKYRTRFLTGKRYLDMFDYNSGTDRGASFKLNPKADFRVHTQPNGGYQVLSNQPSIMDVFNAWNSPTQRSFFVDMSNGGNLHFISPIDNNSVGTYHKVKGY